MTPIQRTVLTHFLNAATLLAAVTILYCVVFQDWKRIIIPCLVLVAAIGARKDYL